MKFVSARLSPEYEKPRGYLLAQGVQDTPGQREDYKRSDRHALQLALFRIPGLLWQPHLSKKGDGPGKPGPLHTPSFLPPQKDALATRLIHYFKW